MALLEPWGSASTCLTVTLQYLTRQAGTADSLFHTDQRVAKLQAIFFTGKVLYCVKTHLFSERTGEFRELYYGSLYNLTGRLDLILIQQIDQRNIGKQGFVHLVATAAFV